jgi:hypothetical protein
MARTDDLVALDRAAGEFGAIVGTDVLDREELAIAADHGDHAPPDRDGD